MKISDLGYKSVENIQFVFPQREKKLGKGIKELKRCMEHDLKKKTFTSVIQV